MGKAQAVTVLNIYHLLFTLFKSTISKTAWLNPVVLNIRLRVLTMNKLVVKGTIYLPQDGGVLNIKH